MKQVIAVRFEAEVLDLLRKIAQDRGISVSALVAEAVVLKLKSEAKPD